MKWTESGIEITCNENGLFCVAGMETHYDSLYEARTAAERLSNRQSLAKKIKLDIPVIDQFANNGSITGFNSGNGKLLLRGDVKAKRYERDRYLYPPTAEPLVRQLIAAEAEANRLRDKLREMQITIPVVGYRDEVDLESLVSQLRVNVARAENAAKEQS